MSNVAGEMLPSSLSVFDFKASAHFNIETSIISERLALLRSEKKNSLLWPEQVSGL